MNRNPDANEGEEEKEEENVDTFDALYTQGEFARLWRVRGYYELFEQEHADFANIHHAVEGVRMRRQYVAQKEHIRKLRNPQTRTIVPKNTVIKDATFALPKASDYQYNPEHLQRVAERRATQELQSVSADSTAHAMKLAITRRAKAIVAQLEMEIPYLVNWSNNCTNRTQLLGIEIGDASSTLVDLYERVVKSGRGDIGRGASLLLTELDKEIALANEGALTVRAAAASTKRNNNNTRAAVPLGGGERLVRADNVNKKKKGKDKEETAPNIKVAPIVKKPTEEKKTTEKKAPLLIVLDDDSSSSSSSSSSSHIRSNDEAVVITPEKRQLDRVVEAALKTLNLSRDPSVYAQVNLKDGNREILAHYASWIVCVMLPGNGLQLLRRRLYDVLVARESKAILIEIIIALCASAAQNVTQCAAVNLVMPSDIRLFITEGFLRRLNPTALRPEDQVFLDNFESPEASLQRYAKSLKVSEEETRGIDLVEKTMVGSAAKKYFISKHVWDDYLMNVSQITDDSETVTSVDLRRLQHNLHLPSWATGDVIVAWPGFDVLSYGTRERMEAARTIVINTLMNDVFVDIAYGPRTPLTSGSLIYDMTRALVEAMDSGELAALVADAMVTAIRNEDVVHQLVTHMTVSFCERWYLENHNLVQSHEHFIRLGLDRKLNYAHMESTYRHYLTLTLQYYEFARSSLASGVELRDYQRDIVLWSALQELYQVRSLAGVRGMLVALDPGLGKTMTLLVARAFKKWLSERLSNAFGDDASQLPVSTVFPPPSHHTSFHGKKSKASSSSSSSVDAMDIDNDDEEPSSAMDVSSIDEGLDEDERKQELTSTRVQRHQLQNIQRGHKTLIIAPRAAIPSWVGDIRRHFHDQGRPTAFLYRRFVTRGKGEEEEEAENSNYLHGDEEDVLDEDEIQLIGPQLKNAASKSRYYLDVCRLPKDSNEYLQKMHREIVEKGWTAASPEVDILIVSLNVFSNKRSTPQELFEIPFDAVILDESHLISGRHTKAYQAIQRLKRRSTYCLTGTPVTSSLGNLTVAFRLMGYKASRDPYMVDVIAAYKKRRLTAQSRKNFSSKRFPVNPDKRLLQFPTDATPAPVKQFDVEIAKTRSPLFAQFYRRVTYRSIHTDYRPGGGGSKRTEINVASVLNFRGDGTKASAISDIKRRNAGFAGRERPAVSPASRRWDWYNMWDTMHALNLLPEHEVNHLLFKDSSMSLAFLKQNADSVKSKQRAIGKELAGMGEGISAAVSPLLKAAKAMFTYQREIDALEIGDASNQEVDFSIDRNVVLDGTASTGAVPTGMNPLEIIAPSMVIVVAPMDEKQVKKGQRKAKKTQSDLQAALKKNASTFTYMRMLRLGVISLHLFKYAELDLLFRSGYEARLRAFSRAARLERQAAPATAAEAGANNNENNNPGDDLLDPQLVDKVLGDLPFGELQSQLALFRPVSHALLTYELSHRLNGGEKKRQQLVEQEKEMLAQQKRATEEFFMKPRVHSVSADAESFWKTIRDLDPITDENSPDLYISSRLVDILCEINNYVNHPHWEERIGDATKLGPSSHGKCKMLIFSTFPEALALLGLHMRRVFGALQYKEEIEEIDRDDSLYPSWRYAYYEQRLSALRRDRIVSDFNNSENSLSVVLTTYAMGGVGLNMQGGNVMLDIDRPWLDSTVEQARNRVYRTGQERDVFFVSISSMFSDSDVLLNSSYGSRNDTVGSEALEFLHAAEEEARESEGRMPAGSSNLRISEAGKNDMRFWTIDHYITAARKRRAEAERAFDEMINRGSPASGRNPIDTPLTYIEPTLRAFNDAVKRLSDNQ
jgi:hypothetical protein